MTTAAWLHMANLRKKLEDSPSTPSHLLTEPGIGYRFVETSLRPGAG